MSLRRYLSKSEVLLREADLDLHNNCFNKAISAYWSSIEALLRAFLLAIKKSPPERAGKLISLVSKELKKIDPYADHIVASINQVYIHRRNIEHRSKLADPRLAKYIAELSRIIINHMRKIISALISETNSAIWH